MTQLILIILDDLSKMSKILDAWHKMGVPGDIQPVYLGAISALRHGGRPQDVKW